MTLTGKLKVVVAFTLPMFLLLIVLSNNSMQISVNAEKKTASVLVKEGGEIYQQSCSRCHGADGRSQTAKGKQTRASDLTESNVSNEKGLKIIANGKEMMPAFKKKLSADEMQSVMNYIRGFRE